MSDELLTDADGWHYEEVAPDPEVLAVAKKLYDAGQLEAGEWITVNKAWRRYTGTREVGRD